MAGEAAAAAKGRPVVLGVDDSALEDLSTLSTDVADLSDGMLADITGVLVGIETQRGGEEKESKTTPGEYYTTQDQMIWHVRVDDAFDRGLESDVIQWYFNLPKAIERDGNRRRADPGRNSDYGVLLASLENVGISSNPGNAALYQFTSWKDLIGLHFHRQTRQVEQRNGTKRGQDQLTEVYGIDNDVRAELNLEPVYLAGQERPAETATTRRNARETVPA